MQHAGVAVAVYHAARAAVADELGIVPVIDLAHGRFPEVTAVKVQMPVEIKVFVPAEAAEFFLLAAQMALHFVERFAGVHHRKIAALFHQFDLLEQFQQFVLLEIHQPAVAKTQIAAGQRCERIAERAAFETERFEKIRQFVVIVNQPAGRDARGGLNADRMEKFVRAFDFFADIRQAAIFFVLRDVVRVNGHDDACEAVAGQAAHVVLVPQAAVGADHRVDAAFRRVTNHRAQIAMHHRLAANEEQIADVIFHRDVHHVARFLERDAASRLGIKLRPRKSAEAAIGIANVRDGKLQIARPAMIQHFADELERCSFFGRTTGLKNPGLATRILIRDSGHWAGWQFHS